MEIEVTNEKGETKKLKLRPLFAREVDKGFNLFLKTEHVEDKDKISTFNALMDYMEKVAGDISGLSKDEMGNLYSDDKNKILGYVHEKIQAKVDFLKPSQKQVTSVQEDTAKQSSY